MDTTSHLCPNELYSTEPVHYIIYNERTRRHMKMLDFNKRLNGSRCTCRKCNQQTRSE